MSIHTKKTSASKGFTLIELLVVIAIIGILASVVLASLNSARNKGADAAMKSSINNARAQAELFYDDAPSSYVGLCDNGVIKNIQASVDNAIGAGSFNCGVPIAGAYRLYSPTKTTPVQYYCVDSTGKAGLQPAAPATATAC